MYNICMYIYIYVLYYVSDIINHHLRETYINPFPNPSPKKGGPFKKGAMVIDVAPLLGELTGEAVTAPRNAGHFGGLRQDVGRNLVAQGRHAT